MKTFNYLTASLIVLFISSVAYCQTYETRNYVKIPANKTVYRTQKVTCSENIPAHSTIDGEYKRKAGEIEYTISTTETNGSIVSRPYDKEIKVTYESLPGKANLSINEKDNTKIDINYWLNSTNKIKQWSYVELIVRTPSCTGTSMNSAVVMGRTLLAQDVFVGFERVEVTNIDNPWFENADSVVAVYSNLIGGEPLYYLINKYSRNSDYYMVLQNREFISYSTGSVEFGPITIPMKYRFGYTRNRNNLDVKVNDEFTADLNLGFFGGYKYGRYRVRYEKGKLRDLGKVGGSFGGFINFSAASLDTAATTAALNPLGGSEKVTIGVVSPGIGVMFSLYNVNVGVFAGYDFGVGQYGYRWNYHAKPWLGFGLGYSLSSFWKK